MKQNDQKIYIALGILLLLIVVGFYFVLDKLSNLSQTIQNLQSQTPTNQNPIPNPQTTTTINQNPTPTPPTANNIIDIPTSIIFNTSSSPLLMPQSNLTVTIQDVSKASDGTITVNLKVFSSDAASYSAIGVNNLFQLVDLNNNNQYPLTIQGPFNSIPPQNAVTGSLTFKTDPQNTTIILQVGAGENIKFYQFNFSNQTYKEAILG